MLYAIIDIGSQTMRLAVYDIVDGELAMLYKKKNIVGLAAYVEQGRMTQEGIDRCCEVLAEYQRFLSCFSITRVTAFTTAALRNAQNSREAIAAIRQRTGLAVRVISGDEEATFDFIGATHGLVQKAGLLVDIGGGSTEIVTFSGSQILEKVSLPMGSLAMAKEFSTEILPSAEECEAIRQAAVRVLDGCAQLPEPVSLPEGGGPAVDIAGLGGTFKSGIALFNAVYGFPDENIDIDAARLPSLVHRFERGHAMSQEDAVMLMRAVPDRLATILPGLVIAEAIVSRYGSRIITYSDSGVREGFLYSEVIGKA